MNTLIWFISMLTILMKGCKRDLEVAYKKVKSGGYIMCHDYEVNKDKCLKKKSIWSKSSSE